MKLRGKYHPDNYHPNFSTFNKSLRNAQKPACQVISVGKWGDNFDSSAQCIGSVAWFLLQVFLTFQSDRAAAAAHSAQLVQPKQESFVKGTSKNTRNLTEHILSGWIITLVGNFSPERTDFQNSISRQVNNSCV